MAYYRLLAYRDDSSFASIRFASFDDAFTAAQHLARVHADEFGRNVYIDAHDGDCAETAWSLRDGRTYA